MQSSKSSKMNKPIEKVSNLWEELQSSDRLPKGTLTTACEIELQELMRQIDIMVNTRKKEWERELHAVKMELTARETDLLQQRSALEKKRREVSELHGKLNSMSSSEEQIVTQYEGQITLLRKEVQKIKRDYERLQKKHERNNQDIERETGRTACDHRDMLEEITRLKAKIEDCHQESRDWDIQKRSLHSQVESLEAQRKALAEKCDFVQQQSKSYQSQLDRRRQILDSSEFNLKTQITQLEGQLERANDTIAMQDEKMDKLKENVDEMGVSLREGTRENDRLLEELNRANVRIRKLEEEKANLESDVKSRESFIQMLQGDLEEKSQDASRLEQIINDKDDIIRSLSESDKREQGEELLKLQEQLQAVKTEKRNCIHSEKKLREELARLNTKHESLSQDYEEICKQLTTKTEQVTHLEQTQITGLKKEIGKLKDQLSLVEGSHSSEFDAMRKELATLTGELHDRTIVVSKLSEESDLMRRKLHDTAGLLDKKDAEIQVANSQLESVRKENRKLQHQLNRDQRMAAELTELKLHMAEMSNIYNSNIRQFEAENARLKDEISVLKSDFSEAIENVHGKLRSTQEETNTSLLEMRAQEHQKLLELEKSAEERMLSLEQQISGSPDHQKSSTDESRLESPLSVSTKPRSQSPASTQPRSQIPGPSKPLSHSRPSTKPLSQGPVFRKPHSQEPASMKPHFQSTASTKPHSQAPPSPKPHSHSPVSPSRSVDRSLRRACKSGTVVSFQDPAKTSQNSSVRSPDHWDSPSTSTRSPDHWDSRFSTTADNSSAFQPVSPLEENSQLHPTTGAKQTDRGPVDVSLSEQFLAEETMRAQELEKLIDSHIENLKNDTDDVIRKWVR